MMRSRLKPLVVPAPLQPFVDAGILATADVHLARTLARVTLGTNTTPTDSELLALAFSAWAVRSSHVCLDLAHIEEQVTREVAPRLDAQALARLDELPWDTVGRLATDLNDSALVSGMRHDSSTAPVTRPLVRNGDLLYMTRQWIDEGIVADLLARRFSVPAAVLDDTATTWATTPFADPHGIDSAQVSAVTAVLSHRTVVLLGGPGTGKTYTIAAMLHALAERRSADGGPPLKVALAAPTAKAAQQMTSSIDGALSSKKFPSAHTTDIAQWAAQSGTLHSLLGVRGGNLVRFRHNSRNPLPHDVVIVDEVSMVSLPLMARLLEATTDGTTLVLVGDPQQLQSIETGAVLGELSRLGSDSPNMVTLRENRRQRVTAPDGTTSLNAIGRLADAMRPVSDPDAVSPSVVFGALTSDDGTVEWIEISDNDDPTVEISRLSEELSAFTEARKLAELASTSDPDGSAGKALAAVDSVRVLCAHRQGPWGVSGWNDVVRTSSGVGTDLSAAGRPILVTRNDRSVGLNNGDTGVVVGSVTPRAAFHSHRSSNGSNPLSTRLLEMSALPDTETAFAMTVHKAQGSQYDTVVFVVPPLTSPLLQRELLYTAVTRAVSRLVVIGSRASIERALAVRAERRSSLADRIRTAMASANI